MRSVTRCVVWVLVLWLCWIGISSAQHWYAAGGPVYLRIDSTRVLIKFDTGLNDEAISTVLASVQTVGDRLKNDLALDGFRTYQIREASNWGTAVALLRERTGVYLVEPYYLDSQDSSFVIGETFITAFDSSVAVSEIQRVVANMGAIVDRELSGLRNVYVLRNTPGSGRGLLDVTNAFHDLSNTRWAEPNFIPRKELCSYRVWDDCYPLQNHIKKVIGRINQASVWDFAGLLGSTDSIVVAVIDDGVTSHDYDLPSSRVLPGYDFCTGDTANMRDNDPSPGDSTAHGMA